MSQLASPSESTLNLKPIGTIKTSYSTKYGTPCQPASTKKSTTGIISLNSHSNYEQGLEDLNSFEYIWIIFWFHKNVNWKSKVLPPYGGKTKRVVFATRSPHRSNPVGLSLCKLVEVKGRKIIVENPDMPDGTPILDIKPYISYAEPIPNALSG